MKNYFPHDEGARNDPKLIKVLMKLGQSGKGVYWDIVEMLYEQNGYLLLSECDSYAFALRTDSELINALIKDFGLFENDGTKFWSASLLRRLDVRHSKSIKAAESASKRWKNANAMQTHSEGNANKEKEIKEKETKEDNKKADPLHEAATPCSDTPSKAQEILSHTIPDIQDPKSPLSKKELSGKDAFEEARKSYPGTKRGDKTEWDNFEKKYKKHPDFKTLPELIKTAIEKQKKHRLAMVAAKERFIPEWPYFSTWINQQRWEEEIENFSKEPEPAETSTKRMTDAEYYELMGMLPDEETEIITPKFSLQ